MLSLAGALAPMAAYRQFIVCRFAPSLTRPGKTDKFPIDSRTGEVANAHDPSLWLSFAEACAAVALLGVDHGVGFVLTPACGFFFLDIDNCLESNGQWSPLALQLCGAFAGAAIEVSHSGRGLHVFGRGLIPPHGCKNTARGIELYHEGRFVALGRDAVGDASTDCTAALASAVATYFPLLATSPHGDDWRDGPVAEWSGPLDDETLIARAMRQVTAGAAFGDRASFADLWKGNVEALARAYASSTGDEYDRSSADMALAQHLAYWTGNDHARILRLMQCSALARPKWEREAYIEGTVRAAAARQTRWLADRPAAEGHAPVGQSALILSQATPYDSARALISQRFTLDGVRTVHLWQKEFHRWSASSYRVMSADDARAEVYDFLDRALSQKDEKLVPFSPNQAKTANVIDAFKAAANLPSGLVPPCWLDGRADLPPHELIAFANGLLHIPTRSLYPTTAVYFNHVAVPFNFDANAPTPATWTRFLRDVWPDDSQAIDTLQEVFGYLLTPDTRQQKIPLIVGPKRSGKGTIARVMTATLGQENVAGPTLASLAQPFGLAPLIGKTAAFIADARLGSHADQTAICERLLSISGEDSVSVPRKFLSDYTAKLNVRFVLFSNELPRIADASGALASRFVILVMKHSFFGREDAGLTAKLMRELPGILNWAIEGWHRLNARGHFVEPESSAETARELADLSSPIAAFVRDRCERDAAAEVECGQLFAAWQVWCIEQHRQHAGNLQTFGRDLRAAVPGVSTAQPRQGSTRTRVYRGIRLQGLGTQWHACISIAEDFQKGKGI